MRLFLPFFIFSLISVSASAQTQMELDQLLLELDQLQEELNSYQGQVSATEAQLQEQELLLAQNYHEIFNLEGSIADSENTLSELIEKLNGLELKKKEQEKRLQVEIAAIYQNSSQGPLKILLNQEDPVMFSRMLYYYQSIAANRQQQIDQYLQTTKDLEQTENARLDELARQRQLLFSLVSARGELETRLKNRRETLSELENSIASTQEEIAANQANRERLETLVRSITTTMAELDAQGDQRPFIEIQGECEWPTQGRPIASFGSLRTGSIRWDGVMIESEMGNTVRAIHNGRVVFSDYLRGYGLLIIVDHNDGYLTLYGHNQSLFVEAGDWVLPQQMIAQVGNSGGQQNAALYFEIRKDGEPTNPENWCR